MIDHWKPRSLQGWRARMLDEALRAILSGLVLLIRAYRLFLSPWLAPRCRYLPTCSDYAHTALATHGLLRGGSLALKRLFRCHPWGGSGVDEVPAPMTCKGCQTRLSGKVPFHSN